MIRSVSFQSRVSRGSFRSLVPVLLASVCLITGAGVGFAKSPTAELEIRAPAGNSEIVIRTTKRLAGAIDSLTWNGREFINSFDHGRQLQSASNFDCGSRFTAETFNPTEAGSRRDGRGESSTSRLLHAVAEGASLQTTTQMAFWLNPGERSSGNLAKNQQPLSDHLLTKRVRIGFRDWPHVIEYRTTFSVPIGERHTYAQFEAVTGYMPPEFSQFWRLDLQQRKLLPLSDGPGEQSMPVILSTPGGGYAMGIYSPDQPSPGYRQAGYGRFRFPPQRVVKWNCVFRLRRDDGVPAGDYAFRNYIAVGDRETVRTSLLGVHDWFGRRNTKP